MSSQNELCLVILKEILDSVWSKLDDVPCAIWVANEIRLDAKVLVTVSRI